MRIRSIFLAALTMALVVNSPVVAEGACPVQTFLQGGNTDPDAIGIPPVRQDGVEPAYHVSVCLLYTSDAADE